MARLPLAVAPALGAPRLVPVTADTMEPTFRMGQVLAVVPLDRYRGPGFYVILQGTAPDVIRCEALAGGALRMTWDSGRVAPMTVTRQWFETAVLGQVGAVCRVLDHALMGV